MNHVFRIVWSKALGAWVVVSELATRRGKGNGKDARSPLAGREEHVPLEAWPLRAGILATLLASAGPAFAADKYWDVNGGTVGSGGTGTWNTTLQYWSDSSDGVAGPFTAWNNAALDHAIFGGTAGTVTLGTPITANRLTFNTAGYTLTGNTLTLAGATPTIAANSGVTTINSILAGNAGLTKTGAGTLSLNGANAFTGNVNLDGGALIVANDAALGHSGNNIFTTAGTSLTIGSGPIGAGRTITLGAGGQTVFDSVGNTIAARFTGTGGLTARGSMTNNANDFTGTMGFGQGSHQFTSIANAGVASSLGAGSSISTGSGTHLAYTGAAASSNRDWAFGSTGGHNTSLRNSGSGALTLTGGLFASGGYSSANMTLYAETGDIAMLGEISSTQPRRLVFQADAGRTITLGDANTYAGPTSIIGTVRAGTLANIGNASSFGTGAGGAAITLSNGTLSYTGAGSASNRTIATTGTANAINNDGTGALSLAGDTSLVANGTLSLGGDFVGTNTLSGTVSGGGNLAVDGPGTWVLSGNNTFTGAATVHSGTLAAGSGTAFSSANPLVINGGTLALNGFDITARSLAGTGGTVDLGGNVLTLVSAPGNTSYAGNIAGSGGLTKLGTGTQTLTGANTYTGATTVGGGTLALNFTAAGAPANDIVSSASTLNMGGGTLAVTGSTGQTQNFAATNITAGGNTIAGLGNVTVNLGAINRSSGIVNFVLPTSGGITTTPATVLGGWATVTSGTTTDYAEVDGSGSIVARTTYDTKDNAATWAMGDVVSDEGGLPDTQYFGTVGSNVQLGGLKYTVARASGVTIGAGNTLGVDGTIIVSASVGNDAQTITGGQLTGPAGGGTLGILQNSTGNFTIASTIVDNGSATGFTKAGTGLVTLTGPNTYTGATIVSAGTLAANTIANGGAASAIGASGSASSNLVLEGSTLRYTGTSTSSDRGFTIATYGALTNGTIDVTQAGTDLQFSGVVTSPDDAGLVKTGAGTLTLSNANNDYTGATTVSGGTLAIGTLANGGANSGIGASSNASSNLLLQGGGKLDYLGATAGSDRGFTLGAGGGTIGVSQPATTLTLGGVATGAGALTKDGMGTLVLSGINTYTGGTTVSAGTLRAGSASAFGTGTVAVNAGGTLDVNNQNLTIGSLAGSGTVTNLGTSALNLSGATSTFTGAIGGSGALTRTGGGIQTFLGCNNTYTGVTTISSGTISTDCLADGGFASGIGASGNASSNLILSTGRLTYTGASVSIDRGFTLQGGNNFLNVNDAAATLEFEGVVTGGGVLNKEGAGTLVLSGANTYAGNTRVIGGVLRAGTTNAFGPQGHMTLDDTAGVLLDLNGHNTLVTSLIGGGASGGNITLGDATLTISAIDARSYAGAISGTGNLVMTANNAARVQELTGCSSTYSGTTTINAGVLAVGCLNNGGLASSIGGSAATADKLVLNGGTLRYIGAGSSTDRRFTIGADGGTLDASGTGAVRFTNTAAVVHSGAANTARALTLSGSNTGNNTLAAQIVDNGTGATSLTKTGTGTWVLTNTGSTYTGATTISGGVLAVDKLANGGQASSIGQSLGDASNLIIGSGSTLRYTGSGDSTDRLFTLQTGVSFIESSGTGAIQFTNTGSAAYTGSGARTLALGGTNAGMNVMGGTIIDGPGGPTTLAKNHSGTWVLTGNNSFTGNTVINDGNLMIGNGGTSGNAGAGNVIVANPTSTLSFNRSDIFDFTGTLSGTGNLAQVGSGTTVLTAAANSIGGTTRIDAGTLQVDGGLAVSSIGMNGSGRLTVNGTVQAAGAAPVVIVGDAGASTITVNAGGILRANGDLGAGSDTLVLTGTLDTGAGALDLGTGDDTFTLNDGAVISGAGVDGGGGTDTLNVNNAVARTLDAATSGITGFEALNKALGGTLTLTGSHNFSAGTAIQAGTLQIGNGGASGTLGSGDVLNNGTLAFNRSGTLAMTGVISGTGAVNQIGSGTTILSGNNSYTGATTVSAGTLIVNGNQSAASGTVSVASGATLGGNGTIGGSVVVADGATLAPGSVGNAPGTLNIGQDLTLGSGSVLNYDFGQANVVGGPLNDLVNVGGNLTLAGTLNVSTSPGGSFNPGIYRVISYNGTLTDNGLVLGTMPSSNVFAQTSVANQVNLVNTAGQTLNFWDGDAGPTNDNVVNGGNGVWQSSAGNTNWTTMDGDLNGPFTDASFAIFSATAGTVTVDNSLGQVAASGMQFASDGYRLVGDEIVLAGLPTSTIRVGDGTTTGAGFVATIDNVLSGDTQLVKTDLGTLVLNGINAYTGGTAINGGIVSVSQDANLGDAAGGLSFDGGTLQNTAAFATGRVVSLGGGGGTFQTDAALTLQGAIDGAGALTKTGDATLTLTGDNTYAGGTMIAAGTLQLGNGGTTGSIIGDVVNNATLAFNRSDAFTFGGPISGTGAVNQIGSGTTVLTGNSTYTGGTTIAAGTLRLGNGGTSGSIVGNVANSGTLAFNRSDAFTFGGLISGTGAVNQIGSGTTVLTGNSTYTGGTTITAGTLQLGNGGTSGSIVGNVTNNGSLAFNCSDTFTFGGLISGTGMVNQTGSGTTVLTGDNTYTGGTTIAAGTLQLGNGGTSGSILGDVVANGALAFNRSDTFTFDGLISGTGAVNQIGSGTTVLTGDNTYTGGTTIAAGTLQLGDGGTSGSILGDVVANGALVLNRSGVFILPGAISGTGSVSQVGNGTAVFTGNSTYTGGTTIAAGTLQLGNGGTSGSIAGDVVNNGTLAFDRSDTLNVDGLISGTGAVNQIGTGTTVLTANNTYAGPTTISAGALIVNGDQSAATGLTSVAAGGTLGGTGIIGGSVVVADDGIINPGNPGDAPGTLTIQQDLSLASTSVLNYNFGQANVPGGPLNDLTNVNGDLTLDGIIDVSVSGGGNFDAGIYRIISYGGTLTDNGLETGTIPSPDYFVQTSVANQVNLVNTAGQTLNFWDGAVGQNDGTINGGDGVWQSSAGNDNWTTMDGDLNAPFTDASFAIFSATAGTVTVDNSLGQVAASGMQFASDGYRLVGDEIVLAGLPTSTIRVGDGTTTGAGFVATIDSVLSGDTQLVKADLGTLVLNGVNAYTGGTAINGGTVSVSQDANLGDAAGGLSFDGGTLQNTAAFATGREVGLGGGGGTFQTDADLTVTAAVTGPGALTKTGDATLTLTGDNTYAGGTTIAAGTLQLGNGGTTGSIIGDVLNNGTLAFNRSGTLAMTGAITGTGAVNQIGGGTTILSGNNSYTGATAVSAGTLIVNGNQSAATGTVSVASGATLGGSGTIGGSVVVADGGALNPGDVGAAGTLTINGDLALSSGSMLNYDFGQANVVGGPLNDLVNVGGNLTLAGTLNVSTSPSGAFDPGVYRVFNYNGTLTDNGFVLGTMPSSDVFVQTAVANQVNLVNAAGLTLNFWDGDAGPKNDNAVNGGNGVWQNSAGNTNWTDSTGALNGPFADASFAVFSAMPGTVTVDNSLGQVGASGMQFAVDGYVIEGDALELTGTTATLRVGDGTTDGAGMAATIDAVLTGAAALAKTDLGTLVLGGASTYTGATMVQAGTLRIDGNQSGATGLTTVASGATLAGAGTIGGDVSVADGGRLAPGAAGAASTLTINGGLSLDGGALLDYRFGEAGVEGGALNDLARVGGDLVLDGTLNVTTMPGGSFDVGVYRIFGYGGTLTDNGLAIGSAPSADVYVQTSVANQVNLVNTAGLTLNFWDGPSGANNGAIDGGNGTWNLAGNSDWTESTGALNAPYANGAFAVFMGTPGTVTIDNANGQVQASGLQFAVDGYTLGGDALELTGTTAMIRVGDGTADGADATATVNAALTGAAALVKADLGTLVLNGNNAYTGGTTIQAGTLQVSGDANLGAAAGGLTFEGGTLRTSASFQSGRAVNLAGTGRFLTDGGSTLTLSGALTGTGTGGVSKNGEGTLVFAGSATYGGATTVAAGTLQAGAANAFGAASAHSVLAGGTLDLAGFSQTVGALTHAGGVRLSSTVPGTTLTVNGNYTGNDGTLFFNTVLGGDESATDRLVVAGDTSGTAQVRVNNIGGAGAPTVEGIKLIDVAGASNGTFSLVGDYVFQGDQAVVAGAYAYRLYKNGVSTPGDGDWYLRSVLTNPRDDDDDPLYQPGVPLYEAYAGALQSFNTLGTLHQRMGNRAWSLQSAEEGLRSGEGLWMRAEATNGRYRPEVTTSGVDYDLNGWKLEVGVDTAMVETADGMLVGSVGLHYGSTRSDASSAYGDGRIDVEGHGLMGAMTWYGGNGVYVDGQARVTRYYGDLHSRAIDVPLADRNDGQGYVVGVEAGRRLATGEKWSFTPQMQVSYARFSFDAFEDAFGASVSLQRDRSLMGRLGVTADYRSSWQGAAGAGSSRLYGIANLYREFADGTRVDVDDTQLLTRNERLWGGLGLGGTVDWADGRFSIYGEVLAKTGLEHFGDSHAVTGTLGFRMHW